MDREAQRAYHRAYYQQNRERRKEQIKAAGKRWRERNPDKSRPVCPEYQRAYYEANKANPTRRAQLKAAQYRYSERHPDRRARAMLSTQMGIRPSQVPDALVVAKLAQLQVEREVRRQRQ